MYKIHKFILKHKALVFTALVIFIGVIGFLASSINLEEDISNLIPTGERQEVLKKVLDHTDFSDKIIVSISSQTTDPNPEELTAYAKQFLDSINQQLPEYFDDIQGNVPEEGLREIYNFVYQNLPLFLNEKDYREIEARLEEDSIKKRLAQNYKNLISPTGLVTKEFLFKDPLSITSLGLKKLEELQVEDDFDLYNNFLITKDHRHVLLFISPALPASETNSNSIFVDRMQKIQTRLNTQFTGVEGDIFGGVLYSIANAKQIKKDIKLTLGIAGSIILLILILYYRRIYVPVVIFIPGILGGLTSIAILFLLKGTISAISLGIGAVLLGVSIDYSLHILTHLKNNNHLKKLYKEVTGPVLMSSTTTAIAFLCLLFLKSEALNDLGLFAAISVIVSSLFALILIPILYKVPAREVAGNTILDKTASIDFHKNVFLVITGLILFIAGLFFFTGVDFNNDLATLNYEPEEIKQKEEKIQEISGRAGKSIFLVSYGNTVDEALEHNNDLYGKINALKKNDEINSYSSIGGVVLSTNTQLAGIEQWKEFWTSEKKEQVRNNLISESTNFGFKPESFQSFYDLLTADFDPVYLDDYRNIGNLYLDDFITSAENFPTVTTSVSATPENLKILKEALEKEENVVVVDRVQVNESFLGNLKEEFNTLITISLVAVFIVLFLFYRSLELTFLTLLPIGITWIITLGVLSVLNIEFNILNIIISTFIFGLGLDYSIFITNAFLSEYETGIRVIKTYRTSILLSVITTLLGLGALLFAEHPALKSISLVSIIGIIAALLVTFILQGYIFEVLFIRRKEEGKAPFSFKGFFNTSNYIKGRDKLYHKRKVYDNYRYKKDLPEIKKEFEAEKERYLKISEFIDKKDYVLLYSSGKGLLPVYLNYKSNPALITGIETDAEMLNVALNTYSVTSPFLEFIKTFPETPSVYNTVILSEPPLEFEYKIRKTINSNAKKVIILDPEYSYRWILDSNFEIRYRQNNIVVLQKVE